VVAELKKVTWPSRDEVVRLTLVVIVVSVAVGALLGTADLIFAWLMERLLVP
jgi:preprotein translocase subunit SecE